MAVLSNRKKRVETLQSTAIFSGMPKKDLEALDRHVTAVTLEKGAELAREERAPQQMFVIVDGTATVRRKKRKLAQVGPGDTVGELSLLDGGKQSATVTADGPLTALVVPVNEFSTLLDESPAFARKMLVSLAGRLRETDDALTA